MPLLDCKECGSSQAGYWHCRNRRENIQSILVRVGIFIGMMVIAAVAAVGTVKLG
jgi:hypothetical protein